MNELHREGRVLVLVPTHRDAELTSTVLAQAGFASEECATLERLADEVDLGAGAVLVAEESIAPTQGGPLAAALGRGSAWSDLPVLVLTRPGADSATVAEALRTLGNVVLLERPTRVATLVSAVRTALRARRRQYEIRDHLAELERAATSLREYDRRKDEFLATLAHELRNPLAPIRNALSVINAEPPADPDSAELLAIVERQVDQLVRLVDDLMEVSRITRGRIELRRATADLAEILRSAVETSRPSIESCGHELRTVLPSETMTVDGDAVRLTQVFANLLNNAAKYTDPGGRITVTASRDGDRWSVSVRDTGIGIPKAMLPRVFEMFTQVEPSARRAQGGLGIGLTLVRTLVAMHGGSVEARSEGSGCGSEFLVRLPVAEPAAAQVAPDPVPPAAAGAVQRRVLIADDNRDAADCLAALVRRFGAEPRVVYDGRAALEAISSWRPEIALLDVGMPVMDGCEVAQAVRAQPELRETVLVAVTGWSQREDRIRTRAAGFDDHLVKPADARAIGSLLSSSSRSCLVED